MLTVSRRSYLLSAASPRVMRAAGSAASVEAPYRIARKLAEKRLGDLTTVYLPPSLYDQAEAQGINMACYAKTPPIPSL